jgi:hypothetical protein
MESAPPPSENKRKTSPALALIMLGIIIVGILLFLILRPNPSGDTHKSTTSPASQR